MANGDQGFLKSMVYKDASTMQSSTSTVGDVLEISRHEAELV